MTPPTDIAVHQIFYRPHQRLLLDSAFLPYDNRANPRPWLAEQHVFDEEYGAGDLFDSELVGFVSWKFRLKTNVSGRRFIDFVAANPGYDVYFINPFPILACRWKNVWVQGDAKHPGMMAFAQRTFENLGYDWDLHAMSNGQETASYCNYWVGTARFWAIYMKHARAILDYIENRCSEAERTFVYSQAGDRHRGHHIPYILERLLSTLLHHTPAIRYCGYRYSDAELASKYGRLAAVVRHANDLKSRVSVPGQPAPPETFHDELTALLAEESARDRRRPISWLKRQLRFY